MKRFPTIVLGLGAMGSAAVYHLARRGHRVLGIDQHSPPHAYGSTHGETRVTRLAIGEGEQYTPLALRSHELWRELEHSTGKRLLTTNGGLIISSSARASHCHVYDFYANTLAAAKKYGIVHELLDAGEIRRRYPQFKVADNEHGYLERDAGFLRPEECVRAHLMLAEREGAEIHRGERVLGYNVSDREVTVTTDRDRYAADKLILAVGAWLPAMLEARLASCFKVYRQSLFWFDIDGPSTPFLRENSPIFIWELQGRTQGIYGFPAVDGPRGGVKIASESFENTTTPEEVSRNAADDEAMAMYDQYVAPYVSGLRRKCLKALTCLYTVTPDFGFVIDMHPESERVLIVSPCSGHGFKHSPAIGEALSEIVLDGESAIDLRGFGLGRFLKTTAS
jgi:sarcosine oxidase